MTVSKVFGACVRTGDGLTNTDYQDGIMLSRQCRKAKQMVEVCSLKCASIVRSVPDEHDVATCNLKLVIIQPFGL